MKLVNLKPASESKVEKYLIDKLNLSSYQKEKLIQGEVIRFSPFLIYERVDNPKTSILWRLTIVFYFLWLLLSVVFAAVRWVLFGRFYYNKTDRMYRVTDFWAKKLNRVGL